MSLRRRRRSRTNSSLTDRGTALTTDAYTTKPMGMCGVGARAAWLPQAVELAAFAAGVTSTVQHSFDANRIGRPLGQGGSTG